MDNNKQITTNIISNNIIGSFFTIMWREESKHIVDFIDPLRISIYHHVIVKEGSIYTFPDIMECSTTCNQAEYNFNNLDEQYKDYDYYINQSDIKKENATPEEVYNTYVEILENKSIALVNSKMKLYRKLCIYKINVMKGHDLPIYGMKIVHTRFKRFDSLFGNDILKEYKLTRKYLRHMKNAL